MNFDFDDGVLAFDRRLIRLSVHGRPGPHPVGCDIPLSHHPEIRGWVEVEADVYGDSVWAVHRGGPFWLHQEEGYQFALFCVSHIPTGLRLWPSLRAYGNVTEESVAPLDATYERATELAKTLALQVPQFGSRLSFHIWTAKVPDTSNLPDGVLVRKLMEAA